MSLLNQLPVRPYPCIGELLTSFIHRICQVNHMEPHTLWRYVSRPRMHYPQSNMSHIIDCAPSSVLDLPSIAYFTGLREEAIEELTLLPVLKKWYGFCIENLPEQAAGQRILSGSIDNSINFCPQCLIEKPYYRLIWQVKEIDTCLQHSIKLINKCPSCLSIIPRLAPNSRIAYCPLCGKPLWESNPDKIESKEEQIRAYEDWEYLLDLKQKSFTNQSSSNNVRSDLAIKILFLACEKAQQFTWDTARSTCFSKSTISMLLQTARDSSSLRRL